MTEPLPAHNQHRGMIAIPYLSPSGEVLDLRFRCFQEHNHKDFFHSKYMSARGARPRIFNVGAITSSGNAIAIAEGEFDAMILGKVGIPAVALPGATVWRPHYRRVFAGFGDVMVFSDPDEAGAEMAALITGSLRNARVIPLQEGDVTDVYLKGGPTALTKLLGGE